MTEDIPTSDRLKGKVTIVTGAGCAQEGAQAGERHDTEARQGFDAFHQLLCRDARSHR